MPSYTLDELIKLMEPQARRDKALITECIKGLALYAAGHAQKDPESPKVAEMRDLVDSMVCYWGLNEPDLHENAKPLKEYLRSFDALIEDAKTGAEFTETDIRKARPDTIYGLYRYGEDMIVSMGDDAKYNILSVSALIKEITAAWDFESDAVNDLTAKLDKAANRMGEVVWRDSPELPGHPAKAETVDRYELKHEIQFDDGQGLAIGYCQYNMKPFAVLPFSDNGGVRNYGIGRPFGTLEQAKADFTSLVAEHEPPTLSDKALIKACIDGLGLYAAYQKRDNGFSDKPDEMRKLVETLVGYWGLDGGEREPSLTDYLDAFDERVFAAKSVEPIGNNTYLSCADVVNGLYRYGQELVIEQGSDVMSEILDMSDLMKDVARYYGYETDTLREMAGKLRAEVREMLAAVTLPGQPAIGANVRYQLKQAVMFGDDRGFVLAQKANAPAPFVTWQVIEREGKWSFDVGHYFSTEERAKLDYISRAEGYARMYKVTEKPLPEAYTAPVVTVTFSEHERLRGVDGMPLYLADALFAELDAKLGTDGQPYYKTDFRIDFVRNGEQDSYLGHFDVGGDGHTILGHIRALAEYAKSNEGYQQYLESNGKADTANAQLDTVLTELLPYFEKHCELSRKEADALSELMSIHEAAEGNPSDTAKVRIEVLEAVREHCARSRLILNSEGLEALSKTPKAMAAEDRAGSGEKPSVLDQIKAARQSPKTPSGEKTERSKKKQEPEH